MASLSTSARGVQEIILQKCQGHMFNRADKFNEIHIKYKSHYKHTILFAEFLHNAPNLRLQLKHTNNNIQHVLVSHVCDS